MQSMILSRVFYKIIILLTYVVYVICILRVDDNQYIIDVQMLLSDILYAIRWSSIKLSEFCIGECRDHAIGSCLQY